MTTITERPETGVASSPTTMPVVDITVHPLYRRRSIGRLRDLQHSISSVGLLRPVPVTAGGMLIAGERRLRAVQNLGWDRIPVGVADNSTHALTLLADESRPHTLQKARSGTEQVLLGLMAESLEHEAAAKRRALGQSHVRTALKRQSREAAIEVTGMSQHYFSQLRRIVLASLGFEPAVGGYDRTPVDPDWAQYSKELLPTIDRVLAGEKIEHFGRAGRRTILTVNAIYEQWTAEYTRRHATVKKTANFTGTDAQQAPAPAGQPATRDAIAKGLATLTGLCSGLGSITSIDPAITSEEAAEFDRDLSNASRVLRGLHNKIKEYANGNA